ncbi:MAG: KamA family protein [Desulfotalea sp.]|nr:MAG: KamA family protein [Desulfotalea sp.]
MPSEAVHDSNVLSTALAEKNWKEMDYRQELKRNITNVDELSRYLPLTAEEKNDIRQIEQIHPIIIPRYYLSLIDPQDKDDPIRRLCVPDAQEMIVAGGMGDTTQDPYGDDKHDKGNGVLHKYDYTALVVTSEYCAMYCRHCFRKRMVGLTNDKTVKNFHKAAEYIADHPEITNVVMSGGDPLMLPTKILKKMLDSLRDIPHLNHVRIGSRVPVSYPIRLFDDELIEVLKDFNSAKTLFVPTHFNHPREITSVSTEAVKRLRDVGVTVNNQAVLLAGVNDNVKTLRDLMNGLLRIGVNPYYLYQCMPVARVRHHFQVPLKKGVDLVDEARRYFDGYAKRFKFIIAHDIGKLEICGRIGNKLVLKQLHARHGRDEEISRLLVRELTETGGWLDDLPEASL